MAFVLWLLFKIYGSTVRKKMGGGVYIYMYNLQRDLSYTKKV